jgi:hypothetical protein
MSFRGQFSTVALAAIVGRFLPYFHKYKRCCGTGKESRMTYYQFIRTVEREVKEAVPGTTQVYIHATLKNNGTIRQGLILKEQGVNISPTIYLEGYYQRLLRGETVDTIVEEILHLYEDVQFHESFNMEFLKEFSKIKKRIVYRLINAETNEQLLEDVPHKKYLDFAIVYYLLLEVTSHGMASMMIHNEHMKKWGVTKQEIHRNACRNTRRLLEEDFSTMSAVIESLTGVEEPCEKDIMYVLSNKLRSFGAAVILYGGCLEGIGEYLGENYYILPSSVHEVIIIPESEVPVQEHLANIVKDVNATQVDAEEVLSNHVYYYDRIQKKLLMEV